MNREPWIVYLTVLLVVIGMMYGKYLIARDDDSNSKDKEEK